MCVGQCAKNSQCEPEIWINLMAGLNNRPVSLENLTYIFRCQKKLFLYKLLETSWFEQEPSSYTEMTTKKKVPDGRHFTSS